MVSTSARSRSTDTSRKYEQIIDIWRKMPKDYKETEVEHNFVTPMLNFLGFSGTQTSINPNLGRNSGLIPDYLVYDNLNEPPILVIEDKKRVSQLANASDEEFIQLCQQHPLYRSAVGYQDKPNDNGIKQYLHKSNPNNSDKKNDPNIDPQKLASYGLVFNGDFFQLWRRVDGLIFPLTPIQRMNEKTIPILMKQLEYVLSNPKHGLVTAIWNSKGGVAKTTNTFNLGATLALQGKRVLLIDWDTQTDLTRAFRLDPKKHAEYFEPCLKKIQIGDFMGDFQEAKNILQQAIKTKNYQTSDKKPFSLSILPNDMKTLDKFMRDSVNFDRSTQLKLLRIMIDLLKEEYDYIFIDTSPSTDVLTFATLSSSDTVLIPSDYSRKSLHHAVDLYNGTIPRMRNDKAKRSLLNVGLWNLGIVFSNCPGDSGVQLEKCIQEELKTKGFTGKQCTTRLKIYAQTKLAEFQHLPVICWQNSKITELYQKLADEIFLNHNFIDH